MKIALYSIGFIILSSCHTGGKTSNAQNSPAMGFDPNFRDPGPPAMVYKTRKDYNDRVAVILSPDKSEVISYPAPSDIDPSKVMPAQLEKGYLLDNRGIDPNVAFLKMTYEEYAKLPKAPSRQELYNMILDKDPLKEMCNCGNRRSIDNPEAQINYLITHNKLESTCKQVK